MKCFFEPVVVWVSVDGVSAAVVISGVSESVDASVSSVVGASVDSFCSSTFCSSADEASFVSVAEPVLGADDPLPGKGTQLAAQLNKDE
ncbi:hypothetical protein PC116_g12750 [Phytophthora cactorum]|nr:hypothetical protein PC119_g9703 [Phytophthora cactorum]KAG4239265.1 hypothetical protein PC116_g12750 [Phytophthora cactorum]